MFYIIELFSKNQSLIIYYLISEALIEKDNFLLNSLFRNI